MNLTLTGIGVWGPGLRGWEDVRRTVRGELDPSAAAFEAPRPEAIPARERRRSGLTVNLAVEVMHQACAMAGLAPDLPATVFASAMGDTDITDYMARKLATEDKLLSPTKFHNSVHNAPSGYWTISAVNRQPSSFVGGFRDSFACGLLEAAACGIAEDLPVGMAAYDIANRPPFGDVLPVSETLGIALLMQPGRHAGWPLDIRVIDGRAAPPRPAHPALARLTDANPAGAGLALLEALAVDENGGGQSDLALTWPLGAGSSLRLTLGPRSRP